MYRLSESGISCLFVGLFGDATCIKSQGGRGQEQTLAEQCPDALAREYFADGFGQCVEVQGLWQDAIKPGIL